MIQEITVATDALVGAKEEIVFHFAIGLEEIILLERTMATDVASHQTTNVVSLHMVVGDNPHAIVAILRMKIVTIGVPGERAPGGRPGERVALQAVAREIILPVMSVVPRTIGRGNVLRLYAIDADAGDTMRKTVADLEVAERMYVKFVYPRRSLKLRDTQRHD